MSTLKVDAIRHNSATSDAITTASDGTCTANITNNLSNRRMNINGGMQVWQRSTSLSVSEGTNEGVTACDRYGFEFGNASAGAATISRSTDVPTNLGFPYSFKIDVTTLNNMSANNTQIRFPYRFEAQDIVSSGWKYNDPNSFLTISFYFKSNKSGTNKLPVQIRTFDGTAYFYIAEITQSDTNWNRYTVKIPGNSNLTFNNDTGMGLEIAWYFAVGSTYHTTADTWGTTQKHGTSNSTNYFDSTSNDMFITGIQIESTTNGIATSFEHRSAGDELARCQRYYEETYVMTDAGNSYVRVPVLWKVEKRVAGTPVSYAKRPDGVGTGTANKSYQASGERDTVCNYSWTGGTMVFVSGYSSNTDCFSNVRVSAEF